MRNAVYLVSENGEPLAVDGADRLVLGPTPAGFILVPEPPAEGNYHLNAVDGVVDDDWEVDV